MIKKLFTAFALAISAYLLIAAVNQSAILPSPIKPAMAPPPSLNTRPSQEPNRIWNLREADIRSVISEVSRLTGKNFVIDPRVQGKITIISNKPMNPREVYQVFLSVLQVSGFAAVPTGHIVKIVPNNDARSIGSDVAGKIIPRSGDEVVVRVVPVRYVPAIQLVPSLRPLMPQWSMISAYEPSNMVIVSGPANTVQQIADIISQVDSSSTGGIDVVPLRHALAMDVVETLKTLITNPNRGFQQQAPPSVAADDRSNSILISGDKTQRIRIRVLVTQLDTQSPSGTSGRTQVIYLKYLQAQDLLPVLAGIAQANFSGTVGTTVGTITTPPLDTSTPQSPSSTMGGGTSSSSTTTQTSTTSSSYGGGSSPSSVNRAATPTTSATSASIEGNAKPKVQIIAEPNSNSIVITAPPSLMRTLKTVIRQLDTRPSQILIEALLTEIDEDSIQQLGIEWGSNTSTSSNGTTSSQFQPGFAVINTQTNINNFEARLHALVTDAKANILSTPSIVVLDNHQAKILVGKQVSIQASNYPNNANGSANGTPYNTFDRENVALHLYVRPQISEGNTVTMQIDQGNDTLQNPNDTTTTPVVNTSSITTSVIVSDGDILVLGGLVQNGLDFAGQKIPIIGDIPGLGHFFQYNIHEKTKKVLMVFIRPIILHNEKQSLTVTNDKYYKIRAEQFDFAHEQPYDQVNKESLMKNLHSVKLPVPFCPPGLKPAG